MRDQVFIVIKVDLVRIIFVGNLELLYREVNMCRHRFSRVRRRADGPDRVSPACIGLYPAPDMTMTLCPFIHAFFGRIITAIVGLPVIEDDTGCRGLAV
ncbi:hypothetical protein FQZ97_1271750 [compost metagenome]